MDDEYGTKLQECCSLNPVRPSMFSSIDSIQDLNPGGRSFDPRFGHFSRGLMLVIATGFIFLSLMTIILTMIIYEKAICGLERNRRNILKSSTKHKTATNLINLSLSDPPTKIDAFQSQSWWWSYNCRLCYTRHEIRIYFYSLHVNILLDFFETKVLRC